ncbi:hypothetical protein PV729_07720 [Streptomyces europaeiscabiei]|uniref:Uncharacterized protein n=1 Tax=Streptomyces europaeiscabiei TaxID=146819 RepID=A0ABU4NDE5_9ACTN|nr:hypothetical protein [Streptomyces europaeiscabiei]MDX3541318.1 hypothetical protein [Streptomyces europaeiscabiei]MDX3551659.1 hypothetical protein [Streptomyces europaeiscabiei]MDX3699898.1 hypothetical protein [Streptomyces europaeiscabiei]
MADDMAARLMAKMRGDSRPSPAQGRPVDPGAQMIMDGLRGGSERDARKAQAEHHNRNYAARREFERRVARRVRELAERHEGGQYPEEKAREQLRLEDLEAKRQADKRAVYDQMVTSNRAEYEGNSTENLRERTRAATTQRREKADAALVAALQAITGAHR